MHITATTMIECQNVQQLRRLVRNLMNAGAPDGQTAWVTYGREQKTEGGRVSQRMVRYADEPGWCRAA